MRRRVEKHKIYRKTGEILPEIPHFFAQQAYACQYIAHWRVLLRRTILAKGQMKSNREQKKPKQDKKVKAAAGTTGSVFATEAKPERGPKGKK
ncbi:MAG: hypothetical protein WA138_11515 [Parvibaculum sp.]